MKINFNFHSVYADIFAQKVEIEIEEPKISVGKLIDILINKYVEDRRYMIVSKNGELLLLLITNGNVMKLTDVIDKDVIIDVFSILVGG